MYIVDAYNLLNAVWSREDKSRSISLSFCFEIIVVWMDIYTLKNILLNTKIFYKTFGHAISYFKLVFGHVLCDHNFLSQIFSKNISLHYLTHPYFPLILLKNHFFLWSYTIKYRLNALLGIILIQIYPFCYIFELNISLSFIF